MNAKYIAMLILLIALYYLRYLLFFRMKMPQHKNTDIIQKSLLEVYEEYPHLKNNIKELIQYESGRYVVFIDCENDLDWETKDEFDESAQSEDFQDILADIDSLQHQPGVRYLSMNAKADLAWYLGRAVCLVFYSRLEKAEEIMKAAKLFLYHRKAEITRRWQLSAALLIYFVSVGGYCMFWMYPTDGSQTLRCVVSCVLYGFTGAMLSIIQRAGKLYYDCSSGRFLNYVQVFAKFVAGGIGALVVVSLYQINLIFSLLKGGTEEPVLFLLGVCGGFSERFAPSLIEKFVMKESL